MDIEDDKLKEIINKYGNAIGTVTAQYMNGKLSLEERNEKFVQAGYVHYLDILHWRKNLANPTESEE